MIILLYKSKRERTECRNYRGLREINARILENRVRRMTKGLIDHKHGCFRSGRVCKSTLYPVHTCSYVWP